ncbi:tRNA(Met) cytidine acetate ligase [Caproiciproducens faecalis]|uniref:tRNA(Met) cytidine acetate ligase n=1 Tax=Caproiciproducens faecalis TaxID=2820301 RepID=A0ABS7DQX9_9FIRM|nr:nucleotidyltransferase family protein [Caproiciproducens faecalis]MBW7573539.1 nucleotidyltransferase family protein [Caproiciproducens faecalis]
MLVAGIVSEYNPFHNGHAALIAQTRKAGATHITAVMSGNFVQRGEPAILSKWARTRQALENGVDLVVELPLPWSLSGAETFAFGGVSLLNAMDVDILSFGSECGNTADLLQAEKALHSDELREKIRLELKSGVTFARARQNAVAGLYGEETSELLRDPNNILGIEYLKALRKLNSDILPFTIKRVGAAHDAHAAEGGVASASQIRKLMRAGEDFSELMPPSSEETAEREIKAGNAPADIALIERAVLAKLRTLSPDRFAALPDISEGLENRVYAAARRAVNLEEMYSLIKSKRYTHARIRRIILSAFLGLESSMSRGTPPYLRILGFNQRGTEILRFMKGRAALPVITNSSDIFSLDKNGKNMLELESRATDLYSLCIPKIAPCGLDRTMGIISI